MNEQQNDNSTPKDPGLAGNQRPIVRIVLSILILSVGLGTAAYLKNSAPRTPKKPPARVAPAVSVEVLELSDYQIVVKATGTVIPSREVELKPRVSGEIVKIAPEFTEGGFFAKGTRVIRIDPVDYELAVARKRSAVTDAEYALKLELGHQEVAKREWELLNGSKPAQDMERELALRQPHLEKARADLAAAQADLQAALLDLERTWISIPFNAMVRSKTVDLGSQVTPQTSMAELVGTDAYRIQVAVPVDRLEWIKIPGQAGAAGADVRVVYGQGHQCSGTVSRLMGDLAAEGRMARILVEVEDPLGLRPSAVKRAPLLIGEYVRVEIQGHRLSGVYRIPRTALRDNSRVWIADEDQKLKIMQVQPVWRDAEVVLVKDGLKAGERLIVSDLPGPVAGMPVRVEAATPEKGGDRPSEKSGSGDRG